MTDADASQRQAGKQAALIPDALGGQRADWVAAQLFSDFSRTLLRGWIEAGVLRVDGAAVRPRTLVFSGQTLVLTVPDLPVENWHEKQPVPFRLVYEDDALLVVDKPAGVVVHPGAGHLDHTLVNGLLMHRATLGALPRAGIVHRLDKDTSGLMVVAATSAARLRLTEMITERRIARSYLALSEGTFSQVGSQPGWIDAPIGRDPRVPTRMAVRADGKAARTRISVLKAFGWATAFEAQLDTGRTHQIRVHLAHRGHPLVGDHRYGAQSSDRWAAKLRGPAEALQALLGFERQALHAKKLSFPHPLTGERLEFEAPPPTDLARLLQAAPLLALRLGGTEPA